MSQTERPLRQSDARHPGTDAGPRDPAAPLEQAAPWPARALDWLRRNLFRDAWNTALTVVVGYLLFVVLRASYRWIFYAARWDVVAANLRLLLVGQYPPDQLWRVWTGVSLVALLTGLSWGRWRGVVGSLAPALAAGLALGALLPVSAGSRLWLLADLAVLGAGLALGRRFAWLGRPTAVGWLLSFPVIVVLLRGLGLPVLPLVGTNLWGGLLLTFLLAIVGIVFSFPLGLLLALGRASRLPAVRWVSIAYIELVRGVPLITILFMAQVMFPLFLPAGINLDRVLRAMIGLTLFSAAYLAENVRGGLQSIPRGQYEAARALGLSGFQMMALIVLPQALRAVIPAIVGQFISLFKDTSLVAIVGLLDLIGIAKSIIANPIFLGRQREVLVFAAAVYWIFTYAMSYASRRLERALGVGQR